ncbi:hypothetical protein [Paenibacillus dendritiformis]|uniref:hypothetical protein n=1 Tax=Paenibacillus dendritiformis TaxID=130049 RepID=UPI00387E18A1
MNSEEHYLADDGEFAPSLAIPFRREAGFKGGAAAAALWLRCGVRGRPAAGNSVLATVRGKAKDRGG